MESFVSMPPDEVVQLCVDKQYVHVAQAPTAGLQASRCLTSASQAIDRAIAVDIGSRDLLAIALLLTAGVTDGAKVFEGRRERLDVQARFERLPLAMTGFNASRRDWAASEPRPTIARALALRSEGFAGTFRFARQLTWALTNHRRRSEV